MIDYHINLFFDSFCLQPIHLLGGKEGRKEGGDSAATNLYFVSSIYRANDRQPKSFNTRLSSCAAGSELSRN